MIAGEAEVLHDGIDELTLAVVFREPVGAGTVDAARDGPVRGLIAPVPANVVPDLLGAAGAQQGRRHGRAIPDPRAGVTARTRLQGRPVAIDQDVGHRRPEGVAEGSSGWWETDLYAPQLGAPLADRGLEQALGLAITRRGRERGGGVSQRRRQIQAPCGPRGKIDVVPQGARGPAEAVVHR